MKTLIWKLKYTLAIRKLVGVSLLTGWEQAGTTVEILGDDINHVSPQQAAEEERDEWLAYC
jgi:hypothetical protein